MPYNVHSVTGKFNNFSAVLVHDVDQLLEVGIDELSQVVDVELLRQLSETRYVDEENCTVKLSQRWLAWKHFLMVLLMKDGFF